MESVHYTYIHYRKSDGKPFYVGKGANRRVASSHGRNEYWHRIAKKHGREHQILGYWDSAEEAYSHERLVISCLREMGYSLANMSDGGEGGATGCTKTEEAKEKTAKHVRKRVLCIDTGDVYASSLEASKHLGVSRATVGTAASGIWRSAGGKRVCYIPKGLCGDELNRWIAARLAEPRLAIGGEAGGLKNGKRVLCLDSGVVYETAVIAGRAVGALPSHIAMAATGRVKTAKGKKFVYVPSGLDGAALDYWSRQEREKHRASLLMNDSAYRVLCISTGRVFESLQAACAAVGASKSTVRAAAAGDALTAAGLRWKYVPQGLHGDALSSWVEEIQAAPVVPSRKVRFGAENSASSPCICVDTGQVFATQRDATQWLRSTASPTARASNISSACAGRLRTAYGYTWRHAPLSREKIRGPI